jgi:thioredoxin 1
VPSARDFTLVFGVATRQIRRRNALETKMTYKIIIISLFVAQFLAFPIWAGDDATNTDTSSAYGIVLRKQSNGNRVIVQPLEGKFQVDADIQYVNYKGILICTGKVQKVYSNLIYSAAEGCENFDDIRGGFGVTYNCDAKKMADKYNTKSKIDDVIRDNEWKKYFGIPMDIEEDQFENLVKNSKIPVYLEFYATWCPYCEQFKPILGEVAKDLGGKARVATIDEAKCGNLKKELGVSSYPSMLLYVDGNIIGRWKGFNKDKAVTVGRIEEAISKTVKKK